MGTEHVEGGRGGILVKFCPPPRLRWCGDMDDARSSGGGTVRLKDVGRIRQYNEILLCIID